MIGVTKRGWAFLGLCGLLYLASMQTTTGLLFLVLGVLFACYVVNQLASWYCVNRLQLDAPKHMRGCEGSTIHGRWTVTNPTSRVLGLAEIKSSWGRLLKIGVLEPGTRRVVCPQLTLPKRGVYPYDKLRLTSAFPFGLIRSERHLPLHGEIIVHPAVYPCPPPRACGLELTLGGRFTGPNRSAMGDQFHGVRPMQDGDAVKLVHWPLSAKGLGMMIREFDEELSGRVALLLDCTCQPATGAERVQDWVARAAGSLALAALDEGHHVELVELGQQQVHRFSPFADPDAVLDVLARLEERPTPPTPDRLAEALQQLPRKSSLCFILAGGHADCIEFIRTSPLCERRTVSLYLPDCVAAPDCPEDIRIEPFGAHWVREPDALRCPP